MVNFSKDRLFPDWEPGFASPWPDWEKSLPLELLSPELRTPGHPELEKPTGTNADTFHIACAKRHNVPLITNEGFGEKGYKRGDAMKRAGRAGVAAHHPIDFYRGHLDEEEEIERFLSRFREEAPRYLDAHRAKVGEDKLPDALTMIFGVYRNVLRGETEGRGTPLRVTVGR